MLFPGFVYWLSILPHNEHAESKFVLFYLVFIDKPENFSNNKSAI